MKYSNKLKIQDVNDYINGVKLKDIAIKYNIKANSSILDWYQKYHESSDIKVFDRKKRNKFNEIRLKNKVSKYSEENKDLKKKLFELESQIKQGVHLIEIKKEKKKREQTEKENELLKKSIASFLIGYQKVNKKTYTKKNIKQYMNYH
ncbi:helix-turn-helix domain-containing protein [Spiroplasma endosymbiont of Cantharis rufa]|uniref:helix-turn-helix domain-containing protein n=1 Tax=Spiroplasma endosymbiont of Cantharis rufa TaxID=3066279 RepID=UPI0030CE058B